MKAAASAVPIMTLLLFLADGAQANSGRSYEKTVETAMYTLGGWGSANIIWGGTELIGGSDDANFHRMNIGWGTINLGLVALTFSEPLPSPGMMTKLLAFNSGFDFAYIATGYYLKARADTTPDADKRRRLRQYGSSIILQGTFLLAFDLAFWLGIEANITTAYDSRGPALVWKHDLR